MNVCPVCEEGTLVTESYSDEIMHQGKLLLVHGMQRSRCLQCGSDPVLANQSRINDRIIAEAKREADGLLSGDQVRAIRTRLGLSQRKAAEYFGGGSNAFSKYERGDVIQSVAMDKLLRLVDKYPALVNELTTEESKTKHNLIFVYARYAKPLAAGGREPRTEGIPVKDVAMEYTYEVAHWHPQSALKRYFESETNVTELVRFRHDACNDEDDETVQRA